MACFWHKCERNGAKTNATAGLLTLFYFGCLGNDITSVRIKSEVMHLITRTNNCSPRTGGGEPRGGDFYWVSGSQVDSTSQSDGSTRKDKGAH